MMPKPSSISLALALFASAFLIAGCSSGETDTPLANSVVPPEELPETEAALRENEVLSKERAAESSVAIEDDANTTNKSLKPEPVTDLPPLTQPFSEEEKKTPVDDIETFAEVSARTFADPPSAKMLTRSHLWLDSENKRLIMDGYVCLTQGGLEMFACPAETKEHESVVAVLPKPSEVHTALLAMGIEPGSPVKFDPEFEPPMGPAMRAWVAYYEDEQFKVVDGRQWVKKSGVDDEVLEEDFVFGGSYVWTDPADDRNYYSADAGDFICVSNFTTAMMDVPFASSTSESALVFEPNTKVLPPLGTPIRLFLQPVDSEVGKPGEDLVKLK
ncbi:MAG: YdjY domain-containing protein [Planctomycetota bacterium]